MHFVMAASKYLTLFVLCLVSQMAMAQSVKSPAEYLNFETGSRFSYFFEIDDYTNYLIQQKPCIFSKIKYGQTPEGRPLYLIIRSSEQNLKKLEELRQKHLSNSDDQKLISWLSFNIHGDEASGSEAALNLLYQLANSNSFLDQLIIIDPCLNPDGRERYVNHINPKIPLIDTFDKRDILYTSAWPGGRYNHYLADLNRDWCWSVQVETQQRMELFRSWKPHLHADFHEMEPDRSYFFPPAAEPVHEFLPDFQIKEAKVIGHKLESLFNKKGWDYFSEKEFDLLYPGYADSYAMFTGAIGLTLEQGGSGEAGVSFIKSNGDTLTLKERIGKHVTVALEILKTTEENKESIIQAYQLFQKNTTTEGHYLIKSDDTAYRNEILELLKRNAIQYSFLNQTLAANTLDIQRQSRAEQIFKPGDIIIPLKQSNSLLLRSIFENHHSHPDFKTYDISSWAVPILFHTSVYKTVLENLHSSSEDPLKTTLSHAPILSFSYSTLAAAKLIFTALKNNLEVFVDKGESTRVFIKNPLEGSDIPDQLVSLAQNTLTEYQSLSLKEWRQIKALKELTPLALPKIAVVFDELNKEDALGDLLLYLESGLKIPFSRIPFSIFSEGQLENYTTVIISDGRFRDLNLKEDAIKRWIADGGRLILLEGALEVGQQLKTGELNRKNLDEIFYSKLKNDPVSLIQGCSFDIIMPRQSFLSSGLSGNARLILNDIPRFEVPFSRTSFPAFTDSRHLIDGYAGENALKMMDQSLIFGTSYFGNGVVVQSAINPLFRNLLMDGQLIMANALIMPIK